MRLLILSLMLLLLSLNSAYAQRPSPTPSLAAPNNTSGDNANASPYYPTPVPNPATVTGRTLYETQLAWGILGFGAFVLILVVALAWKVNKGFGLITFRIFGLTLVITSGLFLIVTGYSQDQMAPMFALLGTIAGFIFGKTADASGSKDKD